MKVAKYYTCIEITPQMFTEEDGQAFPEDFEIWCVDGERYKVCWSPQWSMWATVGNFILFSDVNNEPPIVCENQAHLRASGFQEL